MNAFGIALVVSAMVGMWLPAVHRSRPLGLAVFAAGAAGWALLGVWIFTALSVLAMGSIACRWWRRAR